MDPRRRPGTVVSWSVATEAFLLASDYTLTTRSTYRGYLKRAGKSLGAAALARLTTEGLASFRVEALRLDGFRATQLLMATRVFLGWAEERGLVRLSQEAIRDALRPPGARPGVPPLARARGRRRGPPPAPFTLDAFGYPAGAAGIFLVAAEIRALREALARADARRWAGLLRGTELPGQRLPGGGAGAVPATPEDAVRVGRGRRRGADGLAMALGPEAEAAGERRLLEVLSRLRAALAAQQQRTLGRSVWRASWTEVEVPALAAGERRAEP